LPAVGFSAGIGCFESFDHTAVSPCRAGVNEKSHNGQKEEMLGRHGCGFGKMGGPNGFAGLRSRVGREWVVGKITDSSQDVYKGKVLERMSPDSCPRVGLWLLGLFNIYCTVAMNQAVGVLIRGMNRSFHLVSSS
jgi:hypothetical protein